MGYIVQIYSGMVDVAWLVCNLICTVVRKTVPEIQLVKKKVVRVVPSSSVCITIERGSQNRETQLHAP